MTRTSASGTSTLHAKSMRNHVQTLGAKSYQSQFEEAPDYVVMFVPGEHFVAAALEADPELWDFAFEKRVLLATPDQPRRHRAHGGAGLAAGRAGAARRRKSGGWAPSSTTGSQSLPNI